MRYKAQMSFKEIENYKSVTFLSEETIYLLPELNYRDNSDLVVILINTNPDILSRIQELYPKLSQCEVMGGFGYGTSYHLYSAEEEAF